MHGFIASPLVGGATIPAVPMSIGASSEDELD
jgi:hypothetical protein